MTVWNHLDHFKREEFDHPDEMSELLLTRLDAARDIAGIPFRITSDYRPGDRRSHGRGTAVDFSTRPRGGLIPGAERWLVVGGLLSAGFRRIGLYDRHYHADVDEQLPDRVVWLGKSQ